MGDVQRCDCLNLYNKFSRNIKTRTEKNRWKANGKKFDLNPEEIFEEKEIGGSGRAGVTMTLN